MLFDTSVQGAPRVLELPLDDESEVEAAELLLRAAYSTADATWPLQGASQAVLLQVGTRRRGAAHLNWVHLLWSIQ